jgi:hypothetical protein
MALCDSKSHFNRLKRVYSCCKRIKFKKIKTSPGPIAVMAEHSPCVFGGASRHLQVPPKTADLRSQHKLDKNRVTSKNKLSIPESPRNLI